MPKKKKTALERADWEADIEPPLDIVAANAARPTGDAAAEASSEVASEGQPEHSAFLTPVAIEPPVYDAHDEAGWLEYLEEHGYCVVQALSEHEVADAEESFWRDAAIHLGWDPHEPKTWHTTERTSAPPGLLNRLRAKLQSGGDTGHMRGWDMSELQWMLHKHAAVRRVYAALSRRHSTASPSPAPSSSPPVDHHDQLSSINGINCFRPHGVHAVMDACLDECRGL